jgi:hypothetical protein
MNDRSRLDGFLWDELLTADMACTVRRPCLLEILERSRPVGQGRTQPVEIVRVPGAHATQG